MITAYKDNIPPRQLDAIVDTLNDDGIALVPTDTLYAFVCSIHSHKASRRLAELKGKKLEKSNFSVLCSSLSMASKYVKQISDTQFRLIKSLDTGLFTFVMQSSNLIPKIFQNKKRTIGIRITQKPLLQEIIDRLDCPLLVTSVPREEDAEEIYKNAELIYEKYSSDIDIAVDTGEIPNEPSTVIDLTSDDYSVIRQGLGIL